MQLAEASRIYSRGPEHILYTRKYIRVSPGVIFFFFLQASSFLFTVMPSQSASWLHSVVSLLNSNVLNFLALSVGDCNLSAVLSTHLDSVVWHSPHPIESVRLTSHSSPQG